MVFEQQASQFGQFSVLATLNLFVFQLWLFWALKKLFWRMCKNWSLWMYLWPKIVHWEKFEGNIFSDPKCSGPLLERLPLETLLSFPMQLQWSILNTMNKFLKCDLWDFPNVSNSLDWASGCKLWPGSLCYVLGTRYLTLPVPFTTQMQKWVLF